MRKKSPTLTEQELQIMKVVWRRGKATVRDVYEDILESRKIAYTTVMTMMGVLEEKGYLVKSQSERAYVYEPAQPKQEVIGGMVRDFVTRVFNGSAKPLLMHLLENDQVSPQEAEEIARLLEERRKRS